MELLDGLTEREQISLFTLIGTKTELIDRFPQSHIERLGNLVRRIVVTKRSAPEIRKELESTLTNDILFVLTNNCPTQGPELSSAAIINFCRFVRYERHKEFKYKSVSGLVDYLRVVDRAPNQQMDFVVILLFSMFIEKNLWLDYGTARLMERMDTKYKSALVSDQRSYLELNTTDFRKELTKIIREWEGKIGKTSRFSTIEELMEFISSVCLLYLIHWYTSNSKRDTITKLFSVIWYKVFSYMAINHETAGCLP